MAISKIRNSLFSNLKNTIGWKTNRKIVVISVDDYGNVRLDSKAARDNMQEAGLTPLSRFDLYDSLENKEDLEMLFETLSSVRDKNGKHAVFTPFAMPCNINFEKMAEKGYREYHYELLPQTFSKLSGYEGTWDLWQEGIRKGLMVPLYHGREHFNLKVFNEKLKARDREVLTALKNRSYASISSSGYDTISVMAAYEFWEFEENEQLKEIVKDGLDQFEKVFGYRSDYFNAPGGREHPVIHKTLKENGVEFIDTSLIKNEHQGKGKYRKEFNYTGKRNALGQLLLVRNVVFEPTDDRGVDWVDFTLKQIEAAFRWNRPAVISSHRVNFCGHIDPKNRKEGIGALKELLSRVVERWPEVEFMAANELGKLINKSS
jgi:hypothetical protein